MTTGTKTRISAWLVATALAACAGSIDAGGEDDKGPGDDDPLSAIEYSTNPGSLDDIYREVIGPRCSGQPGLCHNGQFEPNLSSPALSYAYLVNRPAIERPDRLRVAPGDPDSSFLVDKLRNRNVGTIMPLGAEPLSEEEIRLIEDWIRQDALRRPGASKAPDLDNPPRRPEIAIFDEKGDRLDSQPFTAAVGTGLVLRHSVADFETADQDIPFAAFILIASETGEELVLRPGAERDPQLGVTSYDPDGPMGIGDVLNYRFEFTISEAIQLRNGEGQLRSASASGLQFTPIAIYLDTGGIASFTISPNSLTVE
ncbi:MAG: hypothetical protein MJE77_38810 [Proteobacteria bacterium]|nr:hypothetical protein [Pseudomonadota bacterium]